MTPDLAGRVAMVTEGVEPVGAAVVTRLAGDGADVAYTHRRETRATKESRRHGLAVHADPGDPAQAAAAVARVVQHFGRLDIVVTVEIGRRVDPAPTLRAAVPFLPDGARIVTVTRTSHPAAHVDFALGLAEGLAPRAITVNIVAVRDRSATVRSLDAPAAVAGAVAFLVDPNTKSVSRSQVCIDGARTTRPRSAPTG